MLRRVVVSGWMLLAGIGCSRDLSVAEPPPVLPGALFGRVVVAVPGRAERQPAKGATVALLGSSLSTTANDDGRFALEGIDQPAGKVLFRYVEGTHVRQKLLSLEQLGAGPNRQLSLGDVLVAENASVVGRAVREELQTVRSGHRDTVVFVPEGPFLTYTADDGTFEFLELPEGAIELGFFRSGYRPVVLPALSLRGGEQLTLRDVVLELDPGAGPGAIDGTVRFVPALGDATGTTVVAQTATGGPLAGSVTAAGAIAVTAVPPGVYAVTFAHAGYTPTTVFNVLVASGQTTSVNATLGQGPGFDAGTPPPPPDGGAGDGGAAVCTSTAECGLGRWCDDGFCAPLCSVGSCTGGRFCDPITRTCLTPCSAGCDGGTACDLAIDACVPLCDGSHPCGPGRICNFTTALCEPECRTNADCPALMACNGGACLYSGCALDTQCDAGLMCTGGFCIGRPTAPTDAGVYPCSVPCHCRGDEVCRVDAGICVPAPQATLYFFPGAAGSGNYPGSPAGSLAALAARASRPDIIAMLWDAGTVLAGPLTLDGGVTLAGGYVDCGPTRWVRDENLRTPLSSVGSTAIQIKSTSTEPREDVTLRNLELPSFGAVGAVTATIDLDGLKRPVLDNVALTLLKAGTGTAPFAGVRCTGCTNAELSRVSLLPGQDPAVGFQLIELKTSSAAIDRLTLPDSTFSSTFRAVMSQTSNGPLSITGAQVGVITATGGADGLFRVEQCGTFPLTVSNNTLRWLSSGANLQRLIVVVGCQASTITGNRVDGNGQLATLASNPAFGTHAVWFESSSGVIANNRVTFPSAFRGAAVAFDVRGQQASVDLHHNDVDGGTSLDFAYPLRVSNVSAGSLAVHDNRFDVVGLTTVGLDFDSVLLSAGLVVRDNVVRVGAPTALGDARAVNATNVVAVLERNQLEATLGGTTYGLNASGNNRLELYQNTWVAGPGLSSGAGAGSIGIALNGTGLYWLVGNSVDVRSDLMQVGSSTALRCGPGQGDVFTSNIFGGGSAPSRTVVENNGSNYCMSGGTFTRNYLWHSGGGGPGAAEVAPNIAANGMNNIYAMSTTPYAAAGPFELAATSMCVDQGAAGPQLDGGFATLDYLGRPRVVGTSADIGAAERP